MSIETEAQRLDSMMDDLSAMSRNQQKNALVNVIKANQLWSEVLDNAAFEAEQMANVYMLTSRLVAAVRQSNALESALENIVRNALRYSHTKIEVGFGQIKTVSPLRWTTMVLALAQRSRTRSSVRSIGTMKHGIVNLAVQDRAWRLLNGHQTPRLGGRQKTARWAVYGW